ncbi:MAG: hypothetical protein H0V48_00090 [Nocardioidaceae bacterium]|nr:hypothetical protein [Nocardioidaceae bacterium]
MATFLHSVARNHALVDGNKRLTWLATVVFLDLNGHAPALSHDDAFHLVIGAADGTLDVEQIARQLRIGPDLGPIGCPTMCAPGTSRRSPASQGCAHHRCLWLAADRGVWKHRSTSNRDRRRGLRSVA